MDALKIFIGEPFFTKALQASCMGPFTAKTGDVKGIAFKCDMQRGVVELGIVGQSYDGGSAVRLDSFHRFVRPVVD